MAKNVLIYGGAGQLGKAVAEQFLRISSTQWSVTSVDFANSIDGARSIILQGDVEQDITNVSETFKAEEAGFDAVICVAGGWAGGGVKSHGIFAGVDKMWKFNVQSAVASSHLAANFLRPGGLVVLTGAAAALGPTPGMVAYGITKAATHHLVSSLASPGSGLPEGSSVLAILPITLDTATNRQGMPDANFDDWTPLDVVGQLLVGWAQDPAGRPASGSLIKLITKDKNTEFIPA